MSDRLRNMVVEIHNGSKQIDLGAEHIASASQNLAHGTSTQAANLQQMSDSGELERILDAVLSANPKSVEEFQIGRAHV